ncbi:hypothetical protein ACVHNB_32895 [Streptomyces sp. YJ-C3]
MPDVGDVVTARLVVSPADQTTGAALVVTRPDGTTDAPVVTSEDDGTVWAAPVTYTLAGLWRLSWTVTGTGASVEHEVVSVAPAPLVATTGRVYATTTQLAEYLGTAVPLDAVRLLTDASRALDDMLRAARYCVDDDGMPTDPAASAAFAEAVCAIVQWWDETGDPVGAGAGWDSVSAGSISLSGRSSSTATPIAAGNLPPRALAALQRVPGGILDFTVWSAW